MKNPWTSVWLGAANRAAATARGVWLAEARRQQCALERGAEKALPGGVSPDRKAPRRSRKTGG
jgi:hypothetical protein